MNTQEIIGILTDLTEFAEIKINVKHPLCTIARFLHKKPELSVNELEFSYRTMNCLNKANIKTIEQLVSCTPDRLLSIRNFGKRCLSEVIEQLGKIDMHLGMDIESDRAAEKFAKSALLTFIQRLESAERELARWKFYLGRHGSTPEEVLYSITKFRLQTIVNDKDSQRSGNH
jgi:hypothetical protein